MNDLQSLLFYIGAFSISIALMRLGSVRRLPYVLRYFFITIGILIPTLIGGLRGSTVGTDTPEYNRMYANIISDRLDTPIEPVTMTIAWISHAVSSSWLFLTIFSLITTLFFFLTISKINRKYMWFMWAIFLFVYFTFSFNIVRQMAAVSILAYAVSCLVSGDKKKFLLWSLFATLTHAMSVVAAVAFYIFYTKNARTGIARRQVAVLSIATTTLVLVAGGSLVKILSVVSLPIFQKILDNAAFYEVSFSVVNGVFYLSMTILALVMYRRIKAYKDYMPVFVMALAFGSALTLLDGFLGHAGRVAYFFVIPALPVILYAVAMSTNRCRKIVMLSMVLVAMSLFIATRYLGDGSDIIPYVTFSQELS